MTMNTEKVRNKIFNTEFNRQKLNGSIFLNFFPPLQLLDLFALNSDSKKEDNNELARTTSNTAAEFMKSLPELWDTKDYDEEYDMSTFISSLKS